MNANALTLASGSIMNPSISSTPISSGFNNFHTPAWSSMSGHAGYPTLYHLLPFRSRLEKLPYRPHLHELGRFFFNLFHRCEEFHRFRLPRRKLLLKISPVAKVPPEQHERIDVAPHFTQIRHQPHFAIQI